MSLPLRPEVQVLVHILPVFKEFAHNFVPGPGYGLDARFYQAEPAPVVGTTKCPESLCLMSALPSSGRRVPPPPRTLLLGLRSYGLMRQSRVALLDFGFWPRSWSLRRLLPVAFPRQAAAGSPGSRAWGFYACLGSTTPPGCGTLAITRTASLSSA